VNEVYHPGQLCRASLCTALEHRARTKVDIIQLHLSISVVFPERYGRQAHRNDPRTYQFELSLQRFPRIKLILLRRVEPDCLYEPIFT
jgi:hypothetical protein